MKCIAASRAVLLCAALLGATWLAGCQKLPVDKFAQAPPLQPYPGWREHKAADFVLMAPDNWAPPQGGRVDTDPDALRNLSNPAVSYGFAPPKGMSTDDAKLVLVDRSVRALPGEARQQMVVYHRKVGGGANLENEAKNLAKTLLIVKEQNTIDVPVGKAVEIRVRTGSVSGDVTHELYYVLVDNEDVFVVRLTAPGNLDPIKQIGRPVANTFRRS